MDLRESLKTRYIFNLFLLLITVSIIAIGCSGGGKSKFTENPEPKIQEAIKNKKFLIVIVESESCRYCEKLNSEVLKTVAVKERLAKDNVNVAIVNAYGNRMITDPKTGKKMEEEAFALAYRVQAFPTIFVFDPNNNFDILYVIGGYVPKKDFIGLLDFLGTGCYQKIEYPQFVKNNKSC